MTAVILFTADGDLEVFATSRAAEDWMEAIDVEAGEYAAAFGPDGAVVEVGTSGGRVVLRPTGRHDRRALDDGLGRYLLRTTGTAPDAVDARAFADEWLRAQWDRRWPQRPAWLARRLHGDPPGQGSGSP